MTIFVDAAMTGRTQCHSIRNVALKFWGVAKSYDVMNMKVLLRSTRAACSVIPIQNLFAPLLIQCILSRAARYFCDATFPLMIFAAGVRLSHFFSRFDAMLFAKHRFSARMSFDGYAPRLAAAILHSIMFGTITSKLVIRMPDFAAITPFISRLSFREIFIDRNADGVCRSFCITESARHGF